MSARDERATVEVIIRGQAANATLKEMQASARALSADLRRLPANSEEFAKKSEEFKKVNSRLKHIQTDLRDTGGMFGWLSKEVKAFGLIAMGALGFQWLSSQVSNIIQRNAELSDSFADIRKTTGMTEGEVKRLNTAFSQMDTRTTTKDLRSIAVAAGQLGIAKGDILKFTAATDKMVVSLSDEFAGGAGEVTKVMGGLRSIFKDITTDKIDQDLLRIGNAVNVLASEGAATGPVVTDFANRIGGVGANMGLTSGQILGLSATLEELKVSTERGSTATVKILQRMVTHVKDFAKVAGMDTKEFAELVNRDLFGAFMKVVEGAKKGGDSATALGGILDSLGTEGAGASEVISKLGSNTDLLHTKVNTANNALKSTDSIMQEFQIKNRTLGADMDRLGKGIAHAFTNSTMSSALKWLIGGMADLFDNTKKVSDGMEDEQNRANALAIELQSANLTAERRNEIYEELKGINPDIVAGIDKENISITRLTENLAKYNEQQIKKISLQKKQEEVDKSNEEAAERLTTLSDRQIKAYEVLGKIQRMNGVVGEQAKKIATDETKTVLEKMQAIRKLALAEEWRGGKRDQEARKILALIGHTYNLTKAENDYSSAADRSAQLAKEKAEMEELFGLKEKERLDYSKKTEEELNQIIKDNTLSRGAMAAEAAAAHEELERRKSASTKKTAWEDTEEIKKQQKERERAEKQHAKEVERIWADLLKDMKAIGLENELFDMGEIEKEHLKIMRAHNETLDRINSNEMLKRKEHAGVKEQMIRDLELNTNRKIEDLGKKHADDLTKQIDEALKQRDRLKRTALENELADTAEKYDKQIQQLLQLGQTTEGLEEAKQQALAEIRRKYEEKERSDKQRLQEEIFRATHSTREIELDQVRKHYDALIEAARAAGLSTIELERAKAEKIKEINDQAAGESVRAFLDKWSEAYRGLMDIGRNYQAYVRQSTKADFDRYEEQYQTDKEREQRLYESKIISKETYDARVEKLEANMKARRKSEAIQAHEREKRAARFSAILHGVEAIAGIWAKHAANPVMAGILTGIAAANTAIQIATIESSPVPKYAAGGFHKRPEGFTQGPGLYGSSTGQPFIAGEAGQEYILSNRMLQQPWVANFVEMAEAVRVGRTYAGGGYTGPAGGAAPGSGGGAGSPAELCAAINRLNGLLAQGIEAYINYDDFTKTMGSIESARKASQA